MAKLTPSQKRTRTRRRNAARRRAMLPERPKDRLIQAGCADRAQIQKRLLWFAQARGIPVEQVPTVRNCPTPELLTFCKVHQISLDWMLEGGMAELRVMLRQAPRKPEASESLLEKLERLSPKARAFVAERVEALLEDGA